MTFLLAYYKGFDHFDTDLSFLDVDIILMTTGIYFDLDHCNHAIRLQRSVPRVLGRTTFSSSFPTSNDEIGVYNEHNENSLCAFTARDTSGFHMFFARFVLQRNS